MIRFNNIHISINSRISSGLASALGRPLYPLAAALACQTAAAAAGPPAPISSAAQQPALRQPHYGLRYDDPDVSLGTAPGRGGHPHLVIRTQSGRQSILNLPGFPFEVLSFQKAVGNKIIIIADAAEPAMDVYILDKASLTIKSSFLCYNPSPSPDGHWVLFTKFYPMHGVDEYQSSDFTRLFDVTKSSTLSPSPDADPDSVGVPIYPRTDKLEQVRRDGERITHRLQWDYDWSKDSTKAAFFDNPFHGDPISLGARDDGNVIANAKLKPSAASYLVLVDVSGPRPKVGKLPVRDTPEPKFTFGPSSVALDAVTHGTEQPWLHVEYPYSAFRPR